MEPQATLGLHYAVVGVEEPRAVHVELVLGSTALFVDCAEDVGTNLVLSKDHGRGGYHFGIAAIVLFHVFQVTHQWICTFRNSYVRLTS